MIKNYKMFENKLLDYIIGIPSGQIINIDYRYINNLKQEGLISYSQIYLTYIFKDKDYDNILFQIGAKKKILLPHNNIDEIVKFFQKQRHYKKYTISDYNIIDVEGSIYINNEEYKTFPISFNVINGDFIFKNSKLVMLSGGPKIVNGDFDVSGNNLIDLVDGPTNVGKSYNCSNNTLINLKGSPSIIHGDFDCSNNNLTDLLNGPKKVKGFFDCTGNNLKKVLDYQPECFKLIRYGKPISDFIKKEKKLSDE